MAPYETPTTPALDLDAVAKHYDAIYSGRDSYLWIPVSGSPPGGGGWRTRWTRSGDRNGYLAAVEHWASQGSDVFVPVAGYRREMDEYHHGGRADAQYLLALFADLDCSTGSHAAEGLPAKSDVLAWLDGAWPSTIPRPMLIDSGGGYHLWLPVDGMEYASDSVYVLDRWRAWWVSQFGERGWTLDSGPCAQLAQKPRAAGTTNRKTPDHPRPVLIVAEGAGRVSMRDISAWLPPLPVKPQRRASGRVVARRERDTDDSVVQVDRDPTAPPRPGDQLALGVPVSDLLEALGCVALAGTQWTRPTGTPGHQHISVYHGDDYEPERMTVFSSVLQSEWGIDEGQEHSWTSWDLLGRVVCGGDWSIAAGVAAHVLGAADPTAELIEIIETYEDLETLAEAFPPGSGVQEDRDYLAWLDLEHPEDRDPTYDPYVRWPSDAPDEDPYATRMDDVIRALGYEPVPADDDPTDADWPADHGPAEDPMANADWDALTADLVPPDDPTDDALVPVRAGMSVSRAIGALVSGRQVSAHYRVGLGGETAVISTDPREHGLNVWRQERTPDTKQLTWVQHVITPWVAWRPKVTRHLEVGHDCRAKEVSDDEWSVELVVASGRRWRRGGLTAKESLSLDALDELASGAPMPISGLDIGHVRNMLRMLPPAEKVEEYHSTGWLAPPDSDGPVWLAPAGSVDADGPTDAYTIGPPVGPANERSIVPAMAAMGFIGTEDVPIDDQFKALKLFLGITPHRPEIPIALLGAVWSSVIRPSVRAAVMLAGEKDSGKSLLAAATMRYVSSAPARSRLPNMPIPRSSVAGALARARWHGGIWFVDDYQLDPDPHARANAQAADVLGVVIRAAYGGQGEAKATQTGGARGVSQVTTTALITGEAKAASSSVFSRSVVLPVSAADGIARRGSEIDRFIDRDAKSNGARALMAGFIRHLAGRMRDGHRSLSDLTEHSDRIKHRWDAAHGDLGGRNVETVAVLAAGWDAFRRYARSIGRESTLPSEDEIEAALVRLVATGAVEAQASDPGLIVLEQIGAMLGGCTGHLVMPDGSQPQIRGCGWVTSTSEGEHYSTQHRGGGVVVGVVTADLRHCVLMRAGVQEAARRGRIDGLTAAQIHASLARHHVGETRPGERVARSLASTRPAGWVLPLSAIGVGDDSHDLPAEAGSDEDPDD
ncbi:MAG: hypothetical protein ACYDHU_09120 [Acidimicrobiales bacterium]